MENAVIMASGLGTRMMPLTADTPKPLLKVCGTPMIETVISALQRRGVAEIRVVTGYLGEQFRYLEQKYPNVRIIRNPDYRTVNNISSVYYARELLRQGDCLICEADLFAADPAVAEGQFEMSCYFGKYCEGPTDDWVFDQDASGRITRIGKKGADQYMMTGIAWLKKEDAAFLADAIEAMYGKPETADLFWDDAVNMHLDRIPLTVHPVGQEQIIEIDTPEELAEVNRRFGGTE